MDPAGCPALSVMSKSVGLWPSPTRMPRLKVARPVRRIGETPPASRFLRNTVRVTARDAAEARDALREGRPELLAGTRECAWLDAKGQPYLLDQPKSAAELAKDVAALANTGGGVIVIGLRTRREGSSEVIDEVRPVPTSMVDRDRYRKLVRERVFPFVRDFSTWWIATDEERGVLVIDVPAQVSRDKPFVVSGGDGSQGAADGGSVAVPLRDDDGTHWLSGQELHRLLTAGWNVSGPPAPRVVVAAAPAAPAIKVGEGDPLWAQEFREAYSVAGGSGRLGTPTDLITPAGPGVIQHLIGRNQEPAAICAVPDHKPVVIGGDPWRFILKQCRDASPADYLAMAGLPVSDDTSRTGQRVIRLAGGEWGPGELVQDQRGEPWRWRPVPRLEVAPAFQADRWSRIAQPGAEPDLVIRADMFLPWRGADSWRIDKRGRGRLLDALPAADLTTCMATLASRRGIGETDPGWDIIPERDGGRQSEQTAQYWSVLRATEGPLACTGEAMLVLPGGHRRESVQASAAIRIRLAPDGIPEENANRRLTVTELVDALAAAWQTAMLVIPLALVEDPVAVPLAGPPIAELYVRAVEKYVDGRPEYSNLPDLIDLSPLGRATGSQLRQGGISVTAPLETSPEERKGLVRRAVHRMAVNQWGFIEADDTLGL